MNNLRRPILYCFWVCFLCVEATILSAQTTPPRESRCFSIHVRLNGASVEGPRVITLKSKQTQNTASVEEGCFKLPAALLMEKTLDISFTVPGNKVRLSGIATGFFAGQWDVELADKKFATEVSLPKRARAKQACAVVFHVGEPETALVQTGCREALPGVDKSANDNAGVPAK